MSKFVGFFVIFACEFAVESTIFNESSTIYEYGDTQWIYIFDWQP